VEEALIAIAGAVVGTALGGTGKYWLLRRDAWREARTSGLLLLADVRALCQAEAGARIVTDTEFGVKTWESQRQVLAGFRRGNFPNGYRAPEWLELAGHFAELREFYSEYHPDENDDLWRRAKEKLAAAECLLVRFREDPPVFWYVVKGSIWR
jgi:hypothetical protein